MLEDEDFWPYTTQRRCIHYTEHVHSRAHARREWDEAIVNIKKDGAEYAYAVTIALDWLVGSYPTVFFDSSPRCPDRRGETADQKCPRYFFEALTHSSRLPNYYGTHWVEGSREHIAIFCTGLNEISPSSEMRRQQPFICESTQFDLQKKVKIHRTRIENWHFRTVRQSE